MVNLPLLLTLSPYTHQVPTGHNLSSPGTGTVPENSSGGDGLSGALPRYPAPPRKRVQEKQPAGLLSGTVLPEDNIGLHLEALAVSPDRNRCGSEAWLNGKIPHSYLKQHRCAAVSEPKAVASERI